MATSLPAVLRRLVSGGLTVLTILLLCFALGQFTPGDAFTQLELDPNVSPALLAQLRAEYLPQAPLVERWWSWLSGAAHGNLGYSLEYHRSVLSLLRERAPASLELLASGIAMAWILGLSLALLPAWQAECGRPLAARRWSRVLHAAAALLTAFPLGVMVIFALILAPVAWLPGAGPGSLWLASIALALTFLPGVYLQAAHAITHILNRPLMFQVRAGGGSPWKNLWIHALPNTSDVLIPVATLTVSQALVELVILEPLLGWPGLGQLSIDAAQNKDMAVLAALVLLTSLLVLTCNWASEGMQIWLNPRLSSKLREIEEVVA